MPDKSDSSDDDNQSRKRHLVVTSSDTPRKRLRSSGLVAAIFAPFSFLGGMFGGGKHSGASTERVYEVSDDEEGDDEDIVVVSTSPKKNDPSGPIIFLNADQRGEPRVEAGSDENGRDIERTEEKEEEEIVVEKHVHKTIVVSDDSDENEIQEVPVVPVVHVVQNTPPVKPVIKTSETQQDDDLTVQFVKLVKTPNKDLQNARKFQNEIIFLNENQDDDGSSVQFDTTEAAVFESPTPDESVSRPRTPSDWRTSFYDSGSRNVRDYWRRSSAKKPTMKRTNFMRNFDASTEIKKFATSQIQKTASKSSKIDEISRSKYIKYLQQCGYIDKRASLDSGKVISKSTDLISKAKATVDSIHSSRSNTPSVLSRESSLVFERRAPAGPQTPSSSSDIGSSTKNENISQMMSKLERIRLDSTQLNSDRYKSIFENNSRKVEDLGEELRIRGGHRVQTKDDRFEVVRKNLQFKGIAVRPPKPKQVKEEFPALPDSVDHLIEKAWTKALNQEELFVQEFSIEIRRKDLLTLNGLNWLNDNIIAYYLQLIAERSTSDPKYPKVYAFNTFFYTNIASKGYASVKRWTRKVDIFSYDILLIPVHLGMHWCMAVIDITRKRVEFYDSLYNGDTVVLPTLKAYLASESMDKKKAAFDFSGWTMEQMVDIPRQENGSDCGVFSCQFGEWASRRKAPEFTQKHMRYYRKRMVHEIVTRKLLATL